MFPPVRNKRQLSPEVDGDNKNFLAILLKQGEIVGFVCTTDRGIFLFIYSPDKLPFHP